MATSYGQLCGLAYRNQLTGRIGKSRLQHGIFHPRWPLGTKPLQGLRLRPNFKVDDEKEVPPQQPTERKLVSLPKGMDPSIQELLTQEIPAGLREYQVEAISRILLGYKQGLERQLICLPTGAGKTYTFASLAHVLGWRTLIVVNRIELLRQTTKTLARVYGIPEAMVGVIQGSSGEEEYNKLVVVTTIQTAAKRMDMLTRHTFELLVIDEAHHSTSDTYVRLVEALGFRPPPAPAMDAPAATTTTTTSDSPISSTSGASTQGTSVLSDRGSGSNPEASLLQHMGLGPGNTAGAVSMDSWDAEPQHLPDTLVQQAAPWHAPAVDDNQMVKRPRLLVGVTATPYRADNGNLADIYQQVTFELPVGDLIHCGYLCNVTAQRVMTWLDISSVATDASEDGEGDFVASQLSAVVDDPGRNALVVETYKQRALGRKAVAFCCTVAHAQHLASAFLMAGVPAACVHGGMSARERASLLEAHQRGVLHVLTNVAILTEGYDDPSISCVLMTRPTKSTGLYTQSVGRGLRVHVGKRDCLVLDFTDRFHQLDKGSALVSCKDVFGSAGGDVVRLHGYEQAEREITLKGGRNASSGHMQLYCRQQYTWVPYRQAWYMCLEKDKGFIELAELSEGSGVEGGQPLFGEVTVRRIAGVTPRLTQDGPATEATTSDGASKEADGHGALVGSSMSEGTAGSMEQDGTAVNEGGHGVTYPSVGGDGSMSGEEDVAGGDELMHNRQRFRVSFCRDPDRVLWLSPMSSKVAEISVLRGHLWAAIAAAEGEVDALVQEGLWPEVTMDDLRSRRIDSNRTRQLPATTRQLAALYEHAGPVALNRMFERLQGLGAAPEKFRGFSRGQAADLLTLQRVVNKCRAIQEKERAKQASSGESDGEDAQLPDEMGLKLDQLLEMARDVVATSTMVNAAAILGTEGREEAQEQSLDDLLYKAMDVLASSQLLQDTLGSAHASLPALMTVAGEGEVTGLRVGLLAADSVRAASPGLAAAVVHSTPVDYVRAASPSLLELEELQSGVAQLEDLQAGLLLAEGGDEEDEQEGVLRQHGEGSGRKLNEMLQSVLDLLGSCDLRETLERARSRSRSRSPSPGPGFRPLAA